MTAKAHHSYGFRKIQKNRPKEYTKHDEIIDLRKLKRATFFLQNTLQTLAHKKKEK